jgi:hypothetical protein
VTRSAHWIAEPRLRDAVGDFVNREARVITRQIEVLREHSPYRATGSE